MNEEEITANMPPAITGCGRRFRGKKAMRVLRGNGLQLGVSVVTLIAASVAAVTSANAGAFAVREQSAYYQGMSFAGAGTGDTLSSMYWNSAAAAAVEGFNTESHGSIVFPGRELKATGGDYLNGTNLTNANPLGFSGDANSGEIGHPTFVPASYANYQVNENLFFGLATNAQYGFSTKPENEDFAGTPIATTSEVFSININPTVAYKVTPELAIGVGLQAIYVDLRLRSSNTDQVFPGAAGVADREINVDDWAFGGTAGLSWKPAPGTTLGIGYRSRVEVNASGTCDGAGLSTIGALFNAAAGAPVVAGCGPNTPVDASLTLPDMVTASFSQQVSDRVKLLGTVEWTNWSTLGEQAFFVNSTNGANADVFPLGYDDGWFFALGAEYAYTPYTTLRAGIAYELSPINDEVRNVSLPDDDRLWLSVGASTALTDNISIDLAYTHIFTDDSPINIGPGGAVLSAEATGDIDIIAASFKYKFGAAAPALEPLK
jgi:long-chain fatty acid transport protein